MDYLLILGFNFFQKVIDFLIRFVISLVFYIWAYVLE